MPAGTIALTNNSSAVNGTGTAFTTELKAGDFIGVTVGNSPYTMIVSSITSDTQLTIGGAFNGPTSSGLAWYGVPASLMFAITQQTLNDMATNLRGMTSQMDNWQKIYSDEETVTVVRPDRTTFTGPSWGYIRDLLNSLDVDSISEIADQIHLDAEQVATDKQVVSQAKTDALAARDAAVNAKEAASTSASQAAGSATSAAGSATTATNQATIATDQAVRAKNEADRAAQSGVSLTDVKAMIDACFPVGVPIYWPTSAVPDNATYGIKFLRYNGGSFNTATYPKLAAIHPSGTLPDARADVIRVWDDSRGIDASRTLLSEQLDAAPEISGELTVFGSGAGPLVASATTSGAFSRNTTQSGTFTQSGVSGASYPLVFKASGSSTVYGRNGSTEMRMRNMALNFIVRAN